MIEEYCNNCEFYSFIGHGICRKNAPIAIENPKEDKYEGETLTIWPAVDKYDWCGQYKSRHEETK